MPTEWDVSADLIETEDDGDRFVMWGRTKADSGTMELAVCRVRMATFAAPGERVTKELMGYASGTTNRFPVTHQYRRGSARIYVDGFGVTPSVQYPSDARVKLDRKPARRAPIRATYTAD
jgi:hypothetical protein